MEEHKVLVTDEGELPNLPEGMKRATEDEMFQPADAPRVRSFCDYYRYTTIAEVYVFLC